MTWKQFRELTADIPDDEEVCFVLDDEYQGYWDLEVDMELTLCNFTNDNTIILTEK